jgi:hypothetical protein
MRASASWLSRGGVIARVMIDYFSPDRLLCF